MVDVSIQGDQVVFEVEGLDKLWALRTRLTIPLEHVAGVESDPEQINMWWQGLRFGGTTVPGLFAAGTFYSQDGLVFWDVRHKADTVIVSLTHENYKKLIIEVADPPATIAALRAAIARGHK